MHAEASVERQKIRKALRHFAESAKDMMTTLDDEPSDLNGGNVSSNSKKTTSTSAARYGLFN